MRNTFVLIFIALLVSAAGIFVYFTNASSDAPHQEPLVVKPWVEVVSPRAFIIDTATGSHLRELKTGDEIEQGTKIETPKNALVNVYFPDGSVARIDGESTLIIEEANYEADSHRLVVRMSLAAGRVWSKIIGLATTDSAWEVKTSNAVATVRGTAFGVEYSRGKSTIIGSENNVIVRPVDPITKKTIETVEVIIAPDTFIAFSNSDIDEIESGKKILEATPAPASLLDDDWIELAKEADELMEEKLEEIRETEPNEEAVKDEFRELLQEEFIDAILEQREERAPVSENETQQISDPKITNESITDTTRSTSERTVETAPSPVDSIANTRTVTTPKSIEITTKTRLAEVTEGTEIPLEAVLSLSDGTTRTVTNEVEWSVVGSIGAVRIYFFASRRCFRPHSIRPRSLRFAWCRRWCGCWR